MIFEWDEKKNSINQSKHGISFEEAQEVFEDPLQISKLDKRFNHFEERWITIGATRKGAIVVVAHLYYDEMGNEIIRIISARKATTRERSFYES
jgi:uncharacterized DUF497 family protein